MHAVGRPRHPSDGGVIELVTRAGETAIIGAVPFAAPRTLVSALQLAADDTVAMQTYADRMRMIAALCSSRFRTDAVNLLCLHTHLDGAVFAGSERRVHLGDDWAAAPQAIPDTAQYVALGHIHKPQSVTAPSPTEYAGSPLQLDFGEAGEAKSFVRIDVAPGRPAQIRRVPYRGARELAVARGTLDELAARRDELAAAGWLKVIAQLSAPEPDLSRKVRALFDNVVAVDFECPSQEREGEAGPTEMRRQGPRRPPPRPPGPPMPVTTAPGRPTRLRVEPTPRMICGPPSRRATRVRCACGSSPPFRPSQCRQLSTRQRARNATRIAIGNAVPARREARAAPSSSPSARSRRRPPGGRRWRPSWAASQPRSRHSRGASRSSSAIS
ncbi:MAG: hypothetical protein E6J91_21290 [Deltaproteobacteria bacterium]|nr:MAG: hypothetical protein E6J91_21290 [Deltaproteobacteria bacterium]